jgi:GMP synthase (glutamine-hydrolysing) B subunit
VRVLAWSKHSKISDSRFISSMVNERGDRHRITYLGKRCGPHASCLPLAFCSLSARERFYNGRTMIHGIETPLLNATTAPEQKRKTVGDTFMRVSEEELRRFGLDPTEVFLAQGTLRPDLIESASAMASVAGTADVIKTHHNDTALVRALRTTGRIIEPLRDLHKDEVRLLGLELGLPPHLIWRQPFPGPGLAVRIICATEPFVTGLEDRILEQLKHHATDKIAISLLACRTVGVQGDCRSYSSLVALSSTAAASPLDYSPNWHSLFHLAKTIPKTVHGVNRVVYVFGPPLTQSHYTDITPTLLTPDCIHQLQLADEIVNKILFKYDLSKSLSQVPVILFPIDFNQPGEENKGKRSICIRTFITNDFMTGVPALPAVDEHHNTAQAAASPSPSPRPSPTPSPPLVSTADAFTTTLAPVAAASASSSALSPLPVPASHADHIPLSNVRFPTMPLVALQEMVREILAQVPMIARVCFDLTSKPPATTEWE